MCDYSLEMYQSRPARQDERYVSNRFPTGSVGFICPGDQSVAICMSCDCELFLSNIPDLVQQQAGVSANEFATFVQTEGLHRDAVRFINGRIVSLQTLGPGVTAILREPATLKRDVLQAAVA